MKFSIAIISVVFNSIEPLKKTLNSYHQQVQPSNIEVSYFVVDGCSSDGTQNFLQSLSNVVFISEPDEGIFDAMNKGATLANKFGCTHCLYLNAGDTFCSSDVLCRIEEFLISNPLSDLTECVLVGETIFTGFSVEPRLQKAFHPSHILNGMPFCHQSVLMPTSLICRWSFDVRYKHSADYAWFCRSFVRRDTWIYLDFPVSIFFEDGLTASWAGSNAAISESHHIRTRILKVSRFRSLLFSFIQRILFIIRTHTPGLVFLFRSAYLRLSRVKM